MDTVCERNDLQFDQSIGIRWWREMNDVHGFDPRSQYVERFWLPVLGPSTTWLIRYLANQLDQAPGEIAITFADAATDLGLGDRSGQHAPFLRTVKRAIDFKMVRFEAGGTLAVRRYLPVLSTRNLLRLPVTTKAAHDRYLRTGTFDCAAGELEHRGRQLALSLLALDESMEETERQLIRWRFSAPLARSCVEFARLEHERRSASPKSDAPRPNTLIARP